MKKETFNNWTNQEFEVIDNPNEGDDVQYVAIHFLRYIKLMREYGVPEDECSPKFYLREKTK